MIKEILGEGLIAKKTEKNYKKYYLNWSIKWLKMKTGDRFWDSTVIFTRTFMVILPRFWGG